MAYKEKGTKLYRARFSMDRLSEKQISIWNVAPIWPGRSKTQMSERQLAALMEEAYNRSSDKAHLILWMPASELHQTPFDPLDMCGPWLPMATLLSGSDPLHIGYLYARSRSKVDWDTRLILDERGKRGPNSSKTVKFLLECLGDIDGAIIDPFAHRSAVLPIWARRMGIRYVGYTASKKGYQMMVKALAQVELPGIQLEIPA